MKRARAAVFVLVWCALAACGGKTLVTAEDTETGVSGRGSTASAGKGGSPPSFGGAPPVSAGAPAVAGSPPSFGGTPEVAGSPPFGKAGAPPMGEAAQLEALRKNILGTWIGTMKTPWSASADCKLMFVFNADGTYSAKGYGCLALYYGSDDDSPEKKYYLDDITAAGEGQGDITVWFAPGNTNQGVLRRVALSGNGLTFQIFKGDYGPFEYSLIRIGQPVP